MTESVSDPVSSGVMSCWPDKVYLFTASVLGCSMYSLLSRYVLFLFCMFAHTCRGHWTYMAAPSWLPQGLFYPCIWSGLSYLVLISAFLYIFDWWICVHYFPNNIFFFFSSCVLLPKHIGLNKHVHFRKHIFQGFKNFGSGLLRSRCFQVFNSRPIPKCELTKVNICWGSGWKVICLHHHWIIPLSIVCCSEEFHIWDIITFRLF